MSGGSADQPWSAGEQFVDRSTNPNRFLIVRSLRSRGVVGSSHFSKWFPSTRAVSLRKYLQRERERERSVSPVWAIDRFGGFRKRNESRFLYILQNSIVVRSPSKNVFPGNRRYIDVTGRLIDRIAISKFYSINWRETTSSFCSVNSWRTFSLIFLFAFPRHDV